MKERGSALLTAVIIVMVLLSISGISFTTLIYQAKTESSEERGLKAYYLAAAGVHYGIAEIWNGSLVDGGSFEIDDPFEQGGKFVGTVNKSGTFYTIESTGYYGSVTERLIRVGYTYVPGSSGGGGGSEGGSYADYEVVSEFPPWTDQDYSAPGTLVSSVNDEGDLRIFYNVWYAHDTDIPGEPDPPWQEVTVRYTEYNQYWQNDIVTYDNRKFIHRWGGPNTGGEPGELTNEWQELTNEWRNYNTYSTGDIVIYDNKLFRARDDGAYNEQPGLASSSWQELTQEWRPFNIYDQDYEVYNEVVYNGNRYRAKWYSKNHIPGSADVWQLIPNTPITPPVLLRVMVTPATAYIAVDETKQTFTAKAIYSDGSTVDVTNTAAWVSSDPTTALMASGGVATGVKTGLWTGFKTRSHGPNRFYSVDTPVPITIPITIPITATFEGKVGTAYLTITTSGEDEGTAAEGFLWEKEIE